MTNSNTDKAPCFTSALYIDVTISKAETNESELFEQDNCDTFDITNFLTRDLLDVLEDSPSSSTKNESEIPTLSMNDSDCEETEDSCNKSDSVCQSKKQRKSSILSAVTKTSESTVDEELIKGLSTEVNANAEDKEKKPFVQREGDWDCMKCKNLNFAFRAHCNRCKCSKTDSELLKMQQVKMMANCIQYTQMVKMMTICKMAQMQKVQQLQQKNISLNLNSNKVDA